MTDEKLIILVSKYECLFDITKPSYSDRVMKDNAWEEISKCLGISVKQCMDRWKKLRDNFRKAYYNRKGKSGDGATTSKLIKFEKELSFIIPFFRNRNQISNVTLSSDDSESGTPLPPPSTSSKCSDHSEVESFASTSDSKKRPRLNKDVATVFEEYLEEKKNTTSYDKALRNFFLSMSDTVATFPKEVQARIKRRVFNIVNEAELSLYENSADLNSSLPINSPPSSNQSTYQQLPSSHQSTYQQLPSSHQSTYQQLPSSHQSTYQQLPSSHQSTYQQLPSSHQSTYQQLSNETYISQNYPDQTTYGYNTNNDDNNSNIH